MTHKQRLLTGDKLNGGCFQFSDPDLTFTQTENFFLISSI